MKLPLIAILLVLSPVLSASDVYTWTDQHGVVHFSDTADHPQAERIVLPDVTPSQAQTVPLVGTTTSSADGQSLPTQSEPFTVQITSPLHGATLRSNPGFIEVIAQLNGQLAVEQSLQLLLDGKPYGAPKVTPHWSLKYIDRGTHTISIQVMQNGTVIASSETITVHLHRASVQQ
ncbi:DUF4124 domain-containing protein [Vibrio hangzhouensis]|uniref:DUF4124 domain-containing protein n=1 Tax=Vibrio hangzhouensis TaxID=462991 RepID=UPI001C96340B|nr:DUF4124 domain-containing protein [Vibrio hangzhouensis]MBY6199608.1 DUF4124 domain-containing protein [Vibrio hangzhouensis]